MEVHLDRIEQLHVTLKVYKATHEPETRQPVKLEALNRYRGLGSGDGHEETTGLEDVPRPGLMHSLLAD
jgi:hypothetical protein